jgi:hypothetical protein
MEIKLGWADVDEVTGLGEDYANDSSDVYVSITN